MAKKILLMLLPMVLVLSLLVTSCSEITNAVQGNKIAAVDSISVTTGAFTNYGYAIHVDLKPTSSAEAGKVYVVDLYEKGTFRATTTISFNQPTINIGDTKSAIFPASFDEFNAYFMKDVSNIFSVKVHEPVTTTTATTSVPTNSLQPTITITSPKGGESWHVGDTVNIQWTSSNLALSAPLIILLILPNGTKLYIDGSVQIFSNIKSYAWTIPQFISGTSIVGNKERIIIMAQKMESYCPYSGEFIISSK
jgi:hypothetical protein